LFHERTNVEGHYLRIPNRPEIIPARIGLCWAGSEQHPRDSERSITAHLFAPVVRQHEGEWVGLTVGPRADDWQGFGFPAPAQQAAGDFLDATALIATCSLVITVDTAVAHLAGALGIPVWNLITKYPDPRWGLEAERTALYQSMRLVRQQHVGDWGEVMQRVAADLQVLSEMVTMSVPIEAASGRRRR
jgi:hypothetical protein